MQHNPQLLFPFLVQDADQLITLIWEFKLLDIIRDT